MSTVHYEKRIVAFIDILGFKSLIEETQQPDCAAKKINNIKQAFDLIYKMLAEHYDVEQIKQVKYSTFSDCIVFSFPARQTNSLFFALLPLIWLQAELVWKHDILLRGVMTIGEIYHDDKIVFGPAMVEAYELETKKAIYPRIILDPKIKTEYTLWLDEVKKIGNADQIYDLENEQRYTFKSDGLLTEDDDGYYYVDYLDKISGEMDEPENYQDFINHVEKLIQPYLKPHIDVSLLKKYVWLQEKLQKIKLKF
ncbi:hypothetical protein HMPREF0017_02216 [Acinetobacter lwoffii SH145]|uniref:hypothetical protein n=1 Tax=Acinetobacter lwoffii TaxID=28090 RepID=UPI0001BBA980|nr:hypothetical protein [Acinetobacter lwoffii]EEY89244.1 hypothetical protein HMPREF0017_02216 [Acinetobacter lwoffii SH145]